MAKKYVVRLSLEERAELTNLVNKGKVDSLLKFTVTMTPLACVIYLFLVKRFTLLSTLPVSGAPSALTTQRLPSVYPGTTQEVPVPKPMKNMFCCSLSTVLSRT